MIFFKGIYLLALLLSVVVYWIVPQKHRVWWMLLSGLAILMHIQLVWTVFFVVLAIYAWLAGRFVAKKPSKVLVYLVGFIIVQATIMMTLKYYPALCKAFWPKKITMIGHVLVPMGVSYFVFRLIAYVLDSFRGIVKKRATLPDFLAYILFVPIFPAGPIEPYNHFWGMSQRSLAFDDFSYALKRILWGYAKKVILVNYLLQMLVYDALKPAVLGDPLDGSVNPFVTIAFLVMSLLYAYLDISAYADLAIGFSRLFGFKVSENMNWPIFATNTSEYWNRWHMTLSNWCRNYVYFPILIRSKSLYLALYSSFLVMGLWHHVGLTWVMWAVWHASGILIYSFWSRLTRKNKKIVMFGRRKPVKVFSALITVLWSSGSFAFINTSGMREAWFVFRSIIQ